MAKNTGMNAKDEKAIKTAKLLPVKAKVVDQQPGAEKNALPPSKTKAMVTSAGKKKNK